LAAFKKLGLSDEVLKVLKELGFESPTDIQQQSIPVLITSDRDFIGLAQTGTGKTAAFGLPLLERIDTDVKATQALVLAPTRELGKQIGEQLQTFSKYMDKLNVLCVYGGAAISNQIKALRKTQHIIIATPGRLIDLIKRKAVNLEQLQFLVLDEADEMLNMGFKEDIDKILSYTHEDKLTWLFSATMPKEIKKIVKRYMEDPFEVRIDAKNQVNKDISHQYTMVRRSDKTEALVRFLDINPEMRGVVFCRTRRDTQDLAEKLLKKKYRADALHGDLSQQQRDRVMGRFRSKELQVLIATDVAARGIDVNDLTHVFHFTLPDDESYYTHRSGRTARAGKKGTSIAFISGKERHKINRLARGLGIEFTKVEVPDTQDIAEIRINNWCSNILETDATNINDDVLQQVITYFDDLSKEEIIAKILSIQLDQLSLGSSKDLNDTEQKGGGGGRRDDRRGGGGGRGRGGDRRRGSGGRRGRDDRRDRGRRDDRKDDRREGSKDGDKKKKDKKYGKDSNSKDERGKRGKREERGKREDSGKRGKKSHRKGRNSEGSTDKRKRKKD